LKVNYDNSGDSNKLSCYNCVPFKIISNIILRIYPDSIITPFLFIAGTDSKYYRRISNHSYGFSPMLLSKSDIDSVHGFNERISFNNYFNFVDYFYNLIQNID